MVENSFTKPPGTVGDLVLLQIKMDQAVFLIAEHEYGLFRARLYLALRFVLLCSHQIAIEISASPETGQTQEKISAFPLQMQKNKIFSPKRRVYGVNLYFYEVYTLYCRKRDGRTQ